VRRHRGDRSSSRGRASTSTCRPISRPCITTPMR
jgi:hypothetical protein